MPMLSDKEGTETDIIVARLRRLVVRSIFAIGALAALCNLGTLAVPLFNMQIFNRVLPTRNLETMIVLAGGLMICLAVWAALEALRSGAQDVLAGMFVAQLSPPLIRSAALAHRPDLAAAEALADLEVVRVFLCSRASLAPFDIAWAPIFLLTLFLMHWGLAALASLCMCLLIAVGLLGHAISHKAILDANAATAGAMRRAADSVNAAEAVLALGMVPTLSLAWQAGQRRAAGLVQRALLRARAVSAATNALRMGMTAAMVATGLVMVINGQCSTGSMVAGNMVLARLLMPFSTIAATRRQWTDVLAAWKRLYTVLTPAVSRRYLEALPAPTPRLVVENLAFLLPGADRPLLRGISFTVEPGEAIAVVGPSSAGKSTLLRLIVGINPPTAGGVYLDGSSTFLWEREDFARHVGFVPQYPCFLDETVLDNIGRMQCDDISQIVAVAKRVGVHRAIAELPYGYSTRLVDNLLSGGQRQRLAMARALLSQPKMLVLDEPTAFLDGAGEMDFLALLAEFRRDGMTVLLATHRPSLLKSVDKVLVLREGTVEKFGLAPEVSSQLRQRTFRLISKNTNQAVIS